MPVWDGTFSETELQIREAGGYGMRLGLGSRPALLVIDVVLSFTGYRGDEILKSITTFPTSCGPAAWTAMPAIERLLAGARAAGLPVFYTRPRRAPDLTRRSSRPAKKARRDSEAEAYVIHGSDIPAEIAPAEADVVIDKARPSAFFGTPLLDYLQRLDIDHLIIAGCTTSGCVRASVYDAFSNSIGVSIAEECVFDRFPTSHRVSLFDMDCKFADVTTLADLLAQLKSVPDEQP